MRRYVMSLIVLSLVFALILSTIGPVSATKPVAPNTRQMSLEYNASQGKPPSGGSKVYDYYLLIGPKWDFNNGKYQNGVPYVICTAGAPEGADVEIISAYHGPVGNRDSLIDAPILLEMLKRHPATRRELKEFFPGLSQQIDDVLSQLVATGRVCCLKHSGELYYRSKS